MLIMLIQKDPPINIILVFQAPELRIFLCQASRLVSVVDLQFMNQEVTELAGSHVGCAGDRGSMILSHR